MRNISLTVAYDGTNYHGWQCQPNAVTIQETLKVAVERILNHEVNIIGGARTDAGVHAMGQVVNFTTSKEIALTNLNKGLNSMLPDDIRIVDARNAVSRLSRTLLGESKVYIYSILNQEHNSPFLQRYVLHHPYRLNVPSMERSRVARRGEHDFFRL